MWPTEWTNSKESRPMKNILVCLFSHLNCRQRGPFSAISHDFPVAGLSSSWRARRKRLQYITQKSDRAACDIVSRIFPSLWVKCPLSIAAHKYLRQCREMQEGNMVRGWVHGWSACWAAFVSSHIFKLTPFWACGLFLFVWRQFRAPWIVCPTYATFAKTRAGERVSLDISFGRQLLGANLIIIKTFLARSALWLVAPRWVTRRLRALPSWDELNEYKINEFGFFCRS